MNRKVISCDSCEFAEKTNSITYPFKCLISTPVPMMVHEYCVGWFGYVGCASHSDFQSERDKVLDELTKWMKGRYDLPALKEKIVELRQAGG
jgi:hypothetical protein